MMFRSCPLFMGLSCLIAVSGEPVTCPSDSTATGYVDIGSLNSDLASGSQGSVFAICPDTTFTFTGRSSSTGENDPIRIDMANTEIQCGSDGSSSNNCVLELAGSRDQNMLIINGNGTKITGLTFTPSVDFTDDSEKAIARVFNSTDFVDCHWKNLVSKQDRMLWLDATPLTSGDPSFNKTFTLTDCSFKNNSGWANLVYAQLEEDGSTYGDVIIQNTVFEENPTFFTMIDGEGGAFTINNSVFRCNIDPEGRQGYLMHFDYSLVDVQSSCFAENAKVAFIHSGADVLQEPSGNYFEKLTLNPLCTGVQVIQQEGDNDNCYIFQADSCPIAGADMSPCPISNSTDAVTSDSFRTGGSNLNFPPAGMSSGSLISFKWMTTISFVLAVTALTLAA